MVIPVKKTFLKEYVDPVGKSVPRIDGRGIVTGQTKYAFDVSFPNMLVGKMLRSPHPHARIISIDTSKAEKLPGVRAVITAKDTSNIKFGSNEYFFPHTVDQMALESEKVRYVGDEIISQKAEAPHYVPYNKKKLVFAYPVLQLSHREHADAGNYHEQGPGNSGFQYIAAYALHEYRIYRA